MCALFILIHLRIQGNQASSSLQPFFYLFLHNPLTYMHPLTYFKLIFIDSICPPFSLSGVIRRGTSATGKSKPWDDQDTTSSRRATSNPADMVESELTQLSVSLRAVLNHFAHSPKSTQLLQHALDALDMVQIKQLTWGGTRMCGFISACQRCSQILVPFLDTVVHTKLRPEESAFLLSPKGKNTLENF